MATTPTPIFPQTIKNAVLTLNNGSGTTVTTLYAAGTNGSCVYNILITSTDTSARDIILYATVSATNYPIAIVSIPITAGTVDTVPSISYLTQSQIPLEIDAFGNAVLYIASGTTLSVAAGTTITSTKVINFFAQIGDF